MPVSVAILAVPNATPSNLYGFVDMLSAVGRAWGVATGREPGEPLFAPTVVAATRAGVPALNGVTIVPHCSLDEAVAPEVVCVPNFSFDKKAGIAGTLTAEVEWLRTCHARGSLITSSCAGAFLLAEAGLLDGGDAATHWAYCRALQEHYPKVSVQPNKVLALTGPGQRVITSGGGTSWQDLVLFIVARLAGVEHAQRLAKLYLVEWHHSGQLPFAAAALSRSADRTIAASQEWLAENYKSEAPVATMARRAKLGERSFARRFKAATGLSPIEYVQTLRIEEAKEMLERSTLPVEEIAAEIGYADGSFFRRLFSRAVGLSPAAYRRKFQILRRDLGGMPAPTESARRPSPRHAAAHTTVPHLSKRTVRSPKRATTAAHPPLR